ncbi:transglutaminase domain-containing protein [Flavobacteriaceae bacterium M23B6Z8]
MKKYYYTCLFLWVFANSLFSQSDAIKALIEKTDELNLDMWELTTFAEENIRDKEQLARFFYHWIGSNIQYDNETYQRLISEQIDQQSFWELQKEKVVYTNRKGVCAGYANLYKWFLDWVNIETVVITGHIRDQRNHYIELETDDAFRHAWNAIKLNGKWMLVDTTWGTSDEKIISEFYFDIKPELSIISHYPADSKWQLLKEPISLDEFNKSQFIKPIWFIIGFTKAPKLLSDKEFYYLTFQNIADNDWSVGLKVSADNINFEPLNDIKVIKQDGLIYFRFRKSKVPKTAYFKVNLAKVKLIENEYMKTAYDDVINFRI